MPARIGLALALRGASTIPMLRSPALVVLALAALLVPMAAGAHTRVRPGTSPARVSAHGLHGDAAATPASRSSRARAAGRTRAQAASARTAPKRAAAKTHDLRRGSRTRLDPQPAHASRRGLARSRVSRNDRAYAANTRQFPQPSQTSGVGRSATPADFLDAVRDPRSHASPPGRATRPAAAQPVGIVSLTRRTPDRPQSESLAEAAGDPLVLPQLSSDRTRRSTIAPLYGSHEILVHQNLMADRDGLDRILNDDDLLDKRRSGQLVPIPESPGLRVDERLPLNRRFCRPWVAQFLSAMAQAHYARFHTPLQVNSAVRTVEFQQHLLHVNGNAAPAEGDTASPHLTGQAIDIAKRWMPLAEISWMRGYLLPLIEGGHIDVEEEFQQACFHISAYRTSAPLPVPGSPGRYLATEAPGATNPTAWSAR